MVRRKVRGSFTIWFAMTLSLVILTMTSLLAYMRGRLVWTAIRRDLDLSAQSLMGEYQQEWVKDYGLYMIPATSLEPGIRFYLDGNLDHPYGQIEIPDLSVESVGSLADPECLQKQITFFMKERGLLDLTKEVLDMLTKSENTDGLKEAKNLTQHTEGLLEAQQYYGQLVTDFYGVGSDGFEYPYSINQCLVKDPSYEEVSDAFGKLVGGGNLSSEDLAVLEKALSYLQETESLCLDARTAAQNYKAAVAGIRLEEGGDQTASSLPIDEAGADKVLRVAKHDQEICRKAAEALDRTLSWIGGDEDQMIIEELDQEFFTVFTDFDYSVSLPYEYKKPAAGWDLIGILRSLQGFDEDIAALAPDEDKDMKLDKAGLDREGGGSGGQDLSADDTKDDLYPDIPAYDRTPHPEERVLLNEYCLGVFQNYRQTQEVHDGGKALNLRGDKIQGHFFQNEVEYLIVGSDNEFHNVNGVRLRLAAFRAALNMAFLMTDANKRAEIESMAAATGGILMPGIGNTAAFAMILAIWGWGEAISDYRQLSEGGSVPLWKTEEDWHTDLTSLLQNALSDNVKPSSRGLSYRQYLRLLLYMVPEETLLGRIQDLLYVNHRYFPLSEAVTSFQIFGTADPSGTFQGLGTSGMGDLTFQAVYGYD